MKQVVVAVCLTISLFLLTSCTGNSEVSSPTGPSGETNTSRTSGSPSGAPTAPAGDTTGQPLVETSQSQNGTGAAPARPAVEPQVRTFLHAVFMMSATNGWALGSGVLSTTDGGRTWVDVTPPGATIRYAPRFTPAYFRDASTGWIAGHSGSDLILWRTTDGGKSWKSTLIEANGPDHDAQLSFPDDHQGWLLLHIVGAAGSEAVMLFGTTDGGATWNRVSQSDPRDAASQIPFGWDKSGITFRADGTGWVSTGNGQPQPILLTTRDGGVTWQTYPVSLSGEGVNSGGVFNTSPPVFFSAADGLLAATSDKQATFFVTHDGGEHWAGRPSVTISTPQAVVWDFINVDRGWVWDGTSMKATIDGGETWTDIQTDPGLKDIQQLDFITEQTGWVLESGQLLKTADGGRTWQQP